MKDRFIQQEADDRKLRDAWEKLLNLIMDDPDTKFPNIASLEEEITAIAHALSEAKQQLLREGLEKDIAGQEALKSSGVVEAIDNFNQEFFKATGVMELIKAEIQKYRAHPGFASDEYPIHTSQELNTVFSAVANGSSGRDWHNDAKTLTRTYKPAKASHIVRLGALEDEIADGISEAAIMEALERLTHEQDSDCVFALLYVSRLLAPPAPLPERTAPVDWINLDNVIAKIGWTPRSTKEREAMRRKVWEYLRFGARAGIHGQRTGPTIIDKETGKPIDTTIDGPLWAFHDRVRSGLFDSMNPPLQVEISMTRAWTALITSPQTAQYLPLGELLGSIPGEQPSGAWARCIGLSLANLWRRKPQEILDGLLQPTRRELLTHYTPKKAPPLQILDSTNPGFARKYWKDALQILVHNEFLADAGEAAQAIHIGGKTLPRQNWKDVWLDERVTLLPGPRMQPAVEASAEARIFPPRCIPAKKTRRKKTGEQ